MHLFRKSAAVFGLAVALLVPGVATNADQASDVAAVHAADDAWIKAYNSGETGTVVALYDENAVVYPPGLAPVRGRAAIREFFTKDMADFMKTGFAISLDANPDGGASRDMAWSSGTWTLKDGSGQVIDTGWYFSVSRKVGGKWLYVRDSWDSNKPAAPPADAASK